MSAAAAMARAGSSLAYPERFYAAATYAGFSGSPNAKGGVTSKFSNEAALLLYALYQQVLAHLLPPFSQSLFCLSFCMRNLAQLIFTFSFDHWFWALHLGLSLLKLPDLCRIFYIWAIKWSKIHICFHIFTSVSAYITCYWVN